MYSKYIIITLIIVLLGGCTNINKEAKNNNMNDPTASSANGNVEEVEELINVNVDEYITEYLKEYNLPLKGENVFDPKNISIGDTVMGLKLLNIEVVEATMDYPFDTVVANFQGEVILTGTLIHMEPDEYWLVDTVIFIADEESSNKLPVSHHDTRKKEPLSTFMIFTNQEDVKEQLNSGPGLTMNNVKVKIQDYIVAFMPSDVFDAAQFVELVD